MSRTLSVKVPPPPETLSKLVSEHKSPFEDMAVGLQVGADQVRGKIDVLLIPLVKISK